MANSLVKIDTVIVPSGGQNTIIFNNISQLYRDLIIKLSIRGQASLDAVDIKVNGVSPTGNNRYFDFGGNGGLRNGVSGNYTALIDSETDNFVNCEIIIYDYSSTSKFKIITSDNSYSPNSGNSYQGMTSNFYVSNSAISSVELVPRNGIIFQQFSTATLYGVPDYQEVTGIKATGTGTIHQDDNYFYHAYTSSGVFVPTQNITADILVIAGGGGSATGGGGAGGVVYHSSQSLTSGTTYPITVGAGGSAGSGTSSDGGNGGNSQFSSLTAAVGGGGGARFSTTSSAIAGLSGGSGGGGSARDTSSQGNGGGNTAGQGNTGGFASDSVTPGAINGGGGGGAGAPGGTSTNAQNGLGNGGNGTPTYSTWGRATGFGDPINGVWYFAGGGRGGRDFKKTGFTGYGSAREDVINGRGGGADATEKRGGSGIVIVRYAR